ncbi:hypothetical protein [uncultured Helicobacter sp.]|uniref:hypothetical protein n=1 Tax=uncultured Helicobacter sp. TaxID=175537 RepID=UPI0026EF0045|nr:hypothetical protein [uncultured Helicobacter sp.]
MGAPPPARKETSQDISHTSVLQNTFVDTPCFSSSQDYLTYITSSIPNIRILEISTPAGDYKHIGTIKYEIFLQHCIGDYLLFMDLATDSIQDALNMLHICKEYDLVIGIARSKPRSLMQKIGAKIFYNTLHILTHSGKKEHYSEFCALSRKCIHSLLHTQDDIKLLKITHFDKALKMYQYPYTPMYIPHRNFVESLNIGLDIIIGQSYKLLRFGTCLCLLFALVNIIYALYILASYIFMPHISQGWTSTSLYLVSMNIGLFLMLSIIGEYIRIILLRLKGSAPYEIINEQSSVVIDFKDNNIQRNPL